MVITILQIAILEDEPAFAQRLRRHIERVFFSAFPNYVVTCFSSIEEARSAWNISRQNPFHLWFFDIELPDGNGIDFAEEVRLKDSDALFIFVSRLEQQVFASLRTRPEAFIRKNCYDQEMDNLLHLLVQRIPKSFQMISFTCLEKDIWEERHVFCREILLIALEHRHLILYMQQGYLKTNLRAFPELPFKLDKMDFCLINRSCAVNLMHVAFLEEESKQAVLKVPFSRKDILKISNNAFLRCQKSLDEFHLKEVMRFVP